MTLERPVKPRAKRTALIVASVPELTSRTRSTGCTRATISAASSVSPGVGAPKRQPISGGSLHRLDDRRVRMPPQDHRPPQEHTRSI